MYNQETPIRGAEIEGGQGGQQYQPTLMVPGKIRQSSGRQSKNQIQPAPSYSPKEARSPAFDSVRTLNGEAGGTHLQSFIQGQHQYLSARGGNPNGTYYHSGQRLSPSPNAHISQNPSQGYIEFMNAQGSQRATGQSVLAGPYQSIQAHGGGGSVLSTRRNSKLPMSVLSGSKTGQVRIHGARMKSQLGMQTQPSGLSSQANQNPNATGAINFNSLDPNILAVPQAQFHAPISAISSPGPHILISQGQHPDEITNQQYQSQNPLPQYVTSLAALNQIAQRAVSGLSQKSNASNRRLSGYEGSTPSAQPIQQQAQIQSQIKQNGANIQQPLQLFSPQTTPNVQIFDHPGQLQQMANTVVGGFSDPGDRSTTAGTTLPNLAASKNSFYKKHRQIVSLTNSSQQPLTNIHVAHQLEAQSQQQQQSSIAQQNYAPQVQQMATTIIQFNGGMPSLAQVQTIGGMTQQTLKMRKIPGRTRKFVNNTQVQQNQQRLNSNSSATDDDTHSNQSRQKGKMLQISGEKLPIKSDQRLSQGASISKKNSPLDIRKSESKLQNQNQISQPYQSKFAIQNDVNKSGGLFPPQQLPYLHEKSNSPVLMPPSLKHKLQNLMHAQNQEASPVITSIKNFSQAYGSVHASQFYTAAQGVSTSISHPGQAQQINEPQEIATIATPQINGVKRDIKIRKVNPSIGKNSQRIQSLHHNLSATPQTGVMPSPSPLTITSLQSLNVYNRGPQNSENSNIMISATSLIKRTVHNDNSPISTQGTRGGGGNLFSGLPRSSQGGDSSLAQVYSSLQNRMTQEQITSTQAYQRNANSNNMKSEASAGGSSVNNSALNSEGTAPIFHTATKNTTKSSISSDDRRRKFTTHVKLYNQKAQLMYGQQSIELNKTNEQQQSKLPLNFSSIPKIIQAHTTSQPSLNNTFAPNPKIAAAFNNTKTDSKEWPTDINRSQNNEDQSQNGSAAILHLESYDFISQNPDNNNGVKTQLLNPVHDPSLFLDDSNNNEISIIYQQPNEDRLDISGFENEIMPKIDKHPNVIVTRPTDEPVEQPHQIRVKKEHSTQDLKHNRSPRVSSPNTNAQGKLAVIEEEFIDETNKSIQSRTKLRAPSSSNRSLSNNSSEKGIKKYAKQEESKRHSIITNGANTSMEQESPIMNKFLNWRKNSEAFRKLFRQIWEAGINPTKEVSEDAQQMIESLAKITMVGNQMTVEEIKRCIVTQRKNQALRDRFQNPYIKRMRQRSLGTGSRSNDYLNFSIGTQPKNNVSSSSIIEENIIIHPSNSMSIINSQSQVNNNLQIPPHPSLYAQALQFNQYQQQNMRKVQARQDYVCGEHELQVSSSDHSKVNKSLMVVDSNGNSGSSGAPGQISKKQASFESQTYNINKLPLSQNELKRLQFSSQKHQSNKVQMVNHKSGGSGTNDNSSNSLVGNALNSSYNKVKSFQHQNSQDGTLSQKSDQNQNRLNKHSSGSDSYYIPQSGESFHYQPIPKTFGQRQSKSMARQGGAGTSGAATADHPMGSVGTGSKNFNDVLSGQKAIFTNRVAAPANEKIQGTLKKWKEIRKLGQGTSGEVFLVQDIVKNAQPQYFVVKKLQIVSPNSGIDKEAIVKLRKEIEVYKKLSHENIVKFYGSEIVGMQFCIYLEYMSGGTIQSNYQQHPMQRLGEPQIRDYTRQILVGLTFLHENKVVHGDLKGANVLVDDSRKTVKLTDFGSAKLVESTVSQSDVNCVIRGSLAWMAPEVLNNRGIRRKADVWSLGCLVIEMAVGGNPWGAELASLDNNYQALMRIVDPTKSPPVPDELSAECKDFISRCLTREYDKRPTAQELLDHPWIQASQEEKLKSMTYKSIQKQQLSATRKALRLAKVIGLPLGYLIPRGKLFDRVQLV